MIGSSVGRTAGLLLLAAIGAPRAALAQSLVLRVAPAEPTGEEHRDAAVEAPVLLNAAEVQELMQLLYPPALHRRPVGAELLVSFAVEVDGTVMPGSTRVLRASDPWLVPVAETIVNHLRLAPAVLRREAGPLPVPVRVLLPLTWHIGDDFYVGEPRRRGAGPSS